MKKKFKKTDNNERWLLTYSDLITLLLIFFIVMYSTCSLDSSKYKELSKSMKGSFKVVNTDSNSEDRETASSDDEILSEEEMLSQVKSKVDELVKDSELEGTVSTSIQEKGLVISFNDTVLFNIGEAAIKEDWKQKLTSVSKVLNGIDNYIRVEGHTDNIAINTPEFHSNWQLSSVRASNVVEFLISDGGIDAGRLSAIGYGENRPVQSNDTEEGRAANRRVNILILNSKLNTSEG